MSMDFYKENEQFKRENNFSTWRISEKLLSLLGTL